MKKMTAGVIGIAMIAVACVITSLVTYKLSKRGPSDEVGQVIGEEWIAPDDFIWACASAAYQIEGGWNTTGRGWSNWDYYSHITQSIKENETGDDGSKFIARMKEDVALFKDMGLTHYRFSLGWPRLIPSGYMTKTLDSSWFDTSYTKVQECLTTKPQFYCIPQTPKPGWNPEGEEVYNELFNLLDEAGIQPMVTLYHWDHPLPLQVAGGWLDRSMVDAFEEYATEAFTRLGGKSKKWIIFNEPTIGPYMLELEYILAHNIGDPHLTSQLADSTKISPIDHLKVRWHVILATARAFKVANELKAKGVLSEDTEVGTTLALSNSWTTEYDTDTLKAAAYHNLLQTHFDADAAFRGYVDPRIKEYWLSVGITEEDYDKIVTKEDLELISKNTAQFIGINYYSPDYVKKPESTSWKLYDTFIPDFEENNTFANGVMRPEALKNLLHYMKSQYGNLPIYMTENGYGNADSADQDVINTDGKVDDHVRCEYVRTHIQSVLEARKDGINVKSYTLWSSHDNLEWVYGYGRRWGAIYVNYQTYERTPKKSFYAYKQIIADNGVKDTKICDTIKY